MEDGRVFGFVKIHLSYKDLEVTPWTFSFQVDKARLKASEQRDGHYLLPNNLTAEDPGGYGLAYVQLTEIESVFRSLRSALAVWPIIISSNIGLTHPS